MPASELRVRLNGQEHQFRDRASVTIGRDPSADVLSANPVVSRVHVVLRLDDGHWVLEDRSSTGTFHGGQRVSGALDVRTPTTVHLGDPRIGDELQVIPGAEAHAPQTPRMAPAGTNLGRLSGSFRTDAAGRIRIGRDPDNDVVLDDVLVSRHHAELVVSAQRGYEIVDLESHNGTFVDGRAVARAHVTDGTVIGLGRHNFRLVGGALELYEDAGHVEFQASSLSVFVGDKRKILDEVSFSLPANSFLAIVGPSGAGKSTLMKALTGFSPADEGGVLYNGRDLYAFLEQMRPRIGYVPQDDILHPQLTVRRALNFAAELRFPPDVSAAERARVVEEVMGELGLSERADLQISKLSGGQRKRTSVALELMTKPSLLFLDEPTSGLDPGFEKSAMELLRGLADGGRTVIVVTHSLQSLDLCDRVIFLAPGGSTAFFGPPAEALDYFERGDYADVFRDVEAMSQDWKTKFAQSRYHQAYIGRPAALGQRPAGADVALPRPPQRSWFGQLSTLVRRQLAIIAADRVLFAILVLLAPIMGLALFAAIGGGGLEPKRVQGQIVTNPNAVSVTFGLAFCVALMGTVDSFREIVKELPILRRERSIGLSLSAYLFSKLAVLGPFVIVQGVILTLIAVLRQGGPNDANVLHFSPVAELSLDIALTGFAAMTTGLFISAIVTSSDKAAPIMAALVAIQLMASGATFDIRGKPVIEQVSQVMSTRWGFSAAASSANVVGLSMGRCHSEPNPSCDREWKHDTGTWMKDLIALGVISAAGVLGAAYFLRRRDPLQRGRPKQARAG